MRKLRDIDNYWIYYRRTMALFDLNVIVYRTSILAHWHNRYLLANCMINFVITITIIIISEADGPEHGYLGLSRLSRWNSGLDWRLSFRH